MELTIEGVVRRITKPQEFTSGKRKCEIHVELANEKYEQIIPIEFWDDNVDEAIGMTVGATIEANATFEAVNGEKMNNSRTALSCR